MKNNVKKYIRNDGNLLPRNKWNKIHSKLRKFLINLEKYDNQKANGDIILQRLFNIGEVLDKASYYIHAAGKSDSKMFNIEYETYDISKDDLWKLSKMIVTKILTYAGKTIFSVSVYGKKYMCGTVIELVDFIVDIFIFGRKEGWEFI